VEGLVGEGFCREECLVVRVEKRKNLVHGACRHCESRSLQSMRKHGRREHLVVGEVRDARQHIRVAAAQGKASLSAHAASLALRIDSIHKRSYSSSRNLWTRRRNAEAVGRSL